MGCIAQPMRWSSCTVVVLQHAAETLTTFDSTGDFTNAGVRIDQPVVEPLVIALSMIMLDELGDRPAQQLLTK